jgi:hypothetical protein
MSLQPFSSIDVSCLVGNLRGFTLVWYGLYTRGLICCVFSDDEFKFLVEVRMGNGRLGFKRRIPHSFRTINLSVPARTFDASPESSRAGSSLVVSVLPGSTIVAS